MTDSDFDLDSVPADLRQMGEKLRSLGYGFHAVDGVPGTYWLLEPRIAADAPRDGTVVTSRTMRGVFTDALRGDLMIKMGDPSWGNMRYGRGAEFTKVKAAGCGPTSLAIVMNYLLLADPAGSRIGLQWESSENGCYRDRVSLMKDIVGWAGADKAIRPNGNIGTSGPALVSKIKDKFQGFAAESFTDTDRAVRLLKTGELLMVGGRQRGWRTRESLIAHPEKPDAKEYKAHFVVLWGADEELHGGKLQILWVLDPANRAEDKAIRYTTLGMHSGKTFIRVFRDPNKNLVDCKPVSGSISPVENPLLSQPVLP